MFRSREEALFSKLCRHYRSWSKRRTPPHTRSSGASMRSMRSSVRSNICRMRNEDKREDYAHAKTVEDFEALLPFSTFDLSRNNRQALPLTIEGRLAPKAVCNLNRGVGVRRSNRTACRSSSLPGTKIQSPESYCIEDRSRTDGLDASSDVAGCQRTLLIIATEPTERTGAARSPPRTVTPWSLR